MDAAPVITFLSDYGLEDDFVGICHGVIAGICPAARIIDITHGVRRHDFKAGAVLLRGALPYMPVGVHVAVVDPDVGAARRAVALRTADGRVLVGPDNGLLWPAAEQAGGVTEAVEISRSRFRLQPVSATFHGRDVFAPVAAHIAAGVAPEETGEPWDPDRLVRFEFPQPRIEGGQMVAAAVHVDRFGNVQLGASHDDLEQTGLKLGHAVELQLSSGGSFGARYVRTFSDARPGELILYEDAHRALAVAVRQGSAAERLGLAPDDHLRIRTA